MKRFALIAGLVFLFHNAFAEGQGVIPAFFNFQSVLTDDGGNPLPNGTSNIVFQITDTGGNILYEESQDVEVVNGQVSAIIGNGLDPSTGAPRGGVLPDIFLTDGPRYLEIAVDGQRPYDRMEVVAVPYALYTDTALKLADGALDSGMIGAGIVKKEHLSAELISYLENDLSQAVLAKAADSGEFSGFVNSVQSSAGASKVGVSSNFIYSGSSTVQGVLKDIDMAVKRRQDEMSSARADYASKISAEATARQDADALVVSSVKAETLARKNADTNEASARSAGDTSISGQLSSHASATSAHGVSGNIVGDSDAQSLSNKVLVSPTIINGAAVGGNLLVTGSVEASRIESPSGGPRLTPFAYATINEIVDDAPSFTNGYNIGRLTTESYSSERIYTVYFSSPATDARYVVITTLEGSDDCGVTTVGSHADVICYTYVADKTNASFKIHTSKSNIMNVLVFDDN